MPVPPVDERYLTRLIAMITGSPIVVRRALDLLLARKWTEVRNSPEVDAYVLAWIASHRDRSRSPRLSA